MSTIWGAYHFTGAAGFFTDSFWLITLGLKLVSQEICRVSALNAGLRHGVGIEDGL